MNIALIRQRYTPYGGAERFVARAMGALSNEGAHLTIVTRQWPANSQGAALICNPFYLGSVWRDWSFAHCVCRKLAQQPFDLVQSHERIACCDVYRAGDGVHAEWLAQRGRALGFWGKLGIALNPYHRYMLAAEKKLFQSPRLKAVICNSHMVRDEILRHFDFAADKLHVIYSGLDTESFHPRLKVAHRSAMRQQYGIPETAPLFLFVGSGFERKGLNTLLQALATLPTTAQLMVVGKDKQMHRFQRLAAKLGIGGRVHFVGGQEDVRPFYGAADAFVLPTLYDPFPNAALEAFACGLPVVTSHKSGAAEFIQDGKNGYVCDALDVNALSRILTRLLDCAFAASLAQPARDSVNKLSPAAMSERLLSLYRTLLQLNN